MRVMIFGDTASGKSTFAKKLAAKTGLPVIHLDEIMDQVGRVNKSSIKELIIKQANKKSWIIEGNAFTKDPDYRIKRADIVFVFDNNRIKTFYKLIDRHFKIKTNRQTRTGSSDQSLDLKYFIPYIFIKFPPRKKSATKLAKSLTKKVVVVKSHRQAEDYLSDLKWYDHP